MGFFRSFTKLPTHYKFDYKPLYYNPKKEDEEKSNKRYNFRKGAREDYGSKITGQFRTRRVVHKSRRQKSNGLNTLSLIALLGAFAAFYLDYLSLTETLITAGLGFLILLKNLQKK